MCVLLPYVSLLVLVMSVSGCDAVVSVEPCGDWALKVKAGRIEGVDPSFRIREDVVLGVSGPELNQVRGELHEALPIWAPDDRFGWMQGERLISLITDECTAPGLLVSESVKVRPVKDDVQKRGQFEFFTQGSDYSLDPLWGAVGRIEGGRIEEDTAVLIDYDYYPCRLDSLVLTNKGELFIRKGVPAVNRISPPELHEDEIAVANLWFYGHTDTLSQESIYPIEREKASSSLTQAAGKTQAEDLLPKTLAKLRSGEPLSILAWGDSVTAMGKDDPDGEFFQNAFVKELKKRFAKASIALHTAGWGGSLSQMWFDAPKGGEYDFQRDCLDLKPDLVMIEFVNDAKLSKVETFEQYSRIVDEFSSIDSEIILITPHFIRHDWMEMSSMKCDDDPRPYVQGLREFATKYDIALADASKYWSGLWRKGIPYIIYLPNSINHPDGRGHALFVKALLELFPSE